MRIGSIKAILLISLVVSACSGSIGQTGETEPFDKTTNSEINKKTITTVVKTTDDSPYDQSSNIEEESAEPTESVSYFKNFSSSFSNEVSSIDRNHPFQTLDSFCTPYLPVKEELVPATVEVKKGDSLAKIASKNDLTLSEILEINQIDDPNLIFVGQKIRVGEELQIGLGPQATGRGITEKSISIVNIKTPKDELQTFGFENFDGDTSEIFSTFIKILNEECGGFHGRKIELEEITTFPLEAFDIDTSTLGTIACLNATKDIPSVIVVDISQFSGPLEDCVVNEQKTALITTKVSSNRNVISSDNRLLIDSFSSEQALSLMLLLAEEQGLLTDKSIAVVADDSLGNYESVITGLVEPLRELNYKAEFHLINCEGGIFCNTGIDRVIDSFLEDPPDVVFPTLNPFSLPELLTQMISNGVQKPQIIQSAFNHQDDEQSTNHIFNYGGRQASEYYDGTIIFSYPYVENQRIFEGQFSPFEEMCIEEYLRVSDLDQHLVEPRRSKMVLKICSITRYIARTLFDAGVNPSRRKIHETLSTLGPVESPGFSFGSFTLEKQTRPSKIQHMEYKFPCSISKEAEGNNYSGCILPVAPPKNISTN
ncbi:MAG: LysM peptidoglycan-binding domain-containing protein [Acidimicrobiales bacterium]|nr:LysM peptidoglycan-binding domain-containing protein [Acidimicrobiales bacterium]